MYNTYKIVPEDAVSHTYNEMYQLIEGGKVGMFRLGDWNVAKWEGLFPGDILVTSYPVLNKGDQPTAQLYSMRGAAVPENSPHKDLSIEFAQFMNTKEGQEIHYKYQSGIIRTDMTFEGLSDVQKYFLTDIHTDKYKQMSPDSYTAQYPYVTKIEEVQQKAIQTLIGDKNANVDEVMNAANDQALEIVKTDRK